MPTKKDLFENNEKNKADNINSANASTNANHSNDNNQKIWIGIQINLVKKTKWIN